MYEEADGDSEANLYVHHDIMLPAFPLAVAWLDCDPAGVRPTANMAAVGSYDTGIEIWDLDVLDAVEPAAVLGGPVAGGSIALAAAEAAAGKGKGKKVRRTTGIDVPAQFVEPRVWPTPDGTGQLPIPS